MSQRQGAVGTPETARPHRRDLVALMPPGPFREFFQKMPQLGWPAFIRGWKPEDLVIADADFLKVFCDRFGALDCRTADPVEAGTAVRDTSGRVLVLTRGNERGLVTHLRASYPDRWVASAIYDLAPNSTSRTPRMSPIGPPDLSRISRYLKTRPTVVLTTPGSDAEYLARLMEQTGLGRPLEYLPRAIAAWGAHSGRFNATRYLLSALERHKGNTPFSLMLYSDVIGRLTENTSFTWSRLCRLIKRADARVVVFGRRDKVFQAGLQGILGRTIHRSIWSMPETVRAQSTLRPDSFDTVSEILFDLISSEKTLEHHLRGIEVKMLYLEELVERPKEVLSGLAQFLDRPMTGAGVDVSDFVRTYRTAGGLIANVGAFRRELIDRLGLHVNVHGSYSGLSEIQLAPDRAVS